MKFPKWLVWTGLIAAYTAGTLMQWQQGAGNTLTKMYRASKNRANNLPVPVKKVS